MIPTDWGHQMAEAFLDAAVSCGAVCPTRFVVPPGWTQPGGCLGDGNCGCRLSASVLEGMASAGQCDTFRTARIELILEVCAPLPANTSANIDPVAAAGIARDHSALRWNILRGIHKGCRSGALCGGCLPGQCSNFTPGAWENLEPQGTCLRYRVVWKWREVVA